MVIALLKEYRLKKGYSRQKLAKIVDINERTILRIEKNETMPLADTFAKLVKALDLSKEEIQIELEKLSK